MRWRTHAFSSAAPPLLQRSVSLPFSNHQDHAGVGVALPDAVQYFRVRKLQEMGCNGIRTSHNPPTPELLDACDELGMLVLDETRMLSSNPEGLAQFENVVRRDRNHPSVFVWSMGNEESISVTETGLKILTSMKQAALKHDASRPISIAPPPAGDYMGKGGLAVCDVMGYNYADPQAEAWHKNNPKMAIIGTENVSAVGTRGAYTATFKTAAIPTAIRIVGLLIPRSIRLMYVRSNPPSRASRSWEISLLSLISRSACPNAFSGPGAGWICLR